MTREYYSGHGACCFNWYDIWSESENDKDWNRYLLSISLSMYLTLSLLVLLM